MIKKFFYRDSLWFGAAIGVAIPLLSYSIIYYVSWLALNYFYKEQILTTGISFRQLISVKLDAEMQFLALGTNIILFRLYMVSWDKEQSGKGMLLATFALAFIYIFLHRNSFI